MDPLPAGKYLQTKQVIWPNREGIQTETHDATRRCES